MYSRYPQCVKGLDEYIDPNMVWGRNSEGRVAIVPDKFSGKYNPNLKILLMLLLNNNPSMRPSATEALKYLDACPKLNGTLRDTMEPIR